jgi:predicted Zn-dependent protease
MSRTEAEGLGEVLDALAGRGLPVAEVYAKRGRSRVVEESAAGVAVSYLREEGWAARAGDDRRSLFAAGTGAPDPAGPGGAWPEADGEALALPDPAALEPVREPAAASGAEPERDPAAGGSWREPPDLDAPLLGEREALGLLATLREELRAELPAARLLGIRLADGASEWRIASRLGGFSGRSGSSPGVSASARSRAAFLRVEAALAERREAAAAVELAARAARAFDPRAVARRLADRLAVAARGTAPERDRGELVLAPPAAARILAGLAPLFVGGRGAELARRLEDREGRLAGAAVTVIDDGRLPGGALAAPVDGEGLPTSAVVLVEEGRYRRPLLPWREAAEARRGRSRGALRAVGCARRPGWRDLPRPGPSHLYLAPGEETAPGTLLAGVARGYYLLDTDGPATIDLAADRLSAPVVGFAVERGRATAPLAGALLEGGIGSFLRGIEAVARDLDFLPLAGALIGSPTLLVTGMEIRGR